MNGKELSIVLRELACSQKTPLCAEWTEAWKDESNLDELLEKYVKGFDFCVKNDYPTLDFSRRNFSDKKDALHRHNIYLDEEVDIKNAASGIYIFLGNCTGSIVFKDFAVGTVYLRHNSNMRIESIKFAKVFVSMYDSSECKTDKDDVSYCKVFNRKKR